MTSKSSVGVVIGLGALVAYLLTRKSDAGDGAAPYPQPPPGVPPPQPGFGVYTWPPGFTLDAAISAAARAQGLPDYIVRGTAIAEDGLRMPPSRPRLENARYGDTYYPMGITAATIALTLGRDYNANPAAYAAMGLNLPQQVDVAARHLRALWARAAEIGRSEEQSLHLLRVGWQGGSIPQSGRLPDWYTTPRANNAQSFMAHWTAAIFSAGGPDIARVPGMAGVPSWALGAPPLAGASWGGWVA